MKKYILLALIIFAIIAASGCIAPYSFGGVTNEKRDVGSFNQITVGCAQENLGKVIITPTDNGSTEGNDYVIIVKKGNEDSLTVEAENRIMPYIKTNVTNDTLNIYFSKSPMFPSEPVKCYLTVKNLTSITYSGSDIQANNLNVNSLILTTDSHR